MDFSSLTIDEKNNICTYWEENVDSGIKYTPYFTPCDAFYIANFDGEVVRQNGLGNDVYDSYYNAYMGSEFFNTFYNYLITNPDGRRPASIDPFLSAPLLQKKIQKIEEQQAINTMFDNSSSHLESVPITIVSAIGFVAVVVVSFVAIKKGLSYILKRL